MSRRKDAYDLIVYIDNKLLSKVSPEDREFVRNMKECLRCGYIPKQVEIDRLSSIYRRERA